MRTMGMTLRELVLKRQSIAYRVEWLNGLIRSISSQAPSSTWTHSHSNYHLNQHSIIIASSTTNRSTCYKTLNLNGSLCGRNVAILSRSNFSHQANRRLFDKSNECVQASDEPKISNQIDNRIKNQIDISNKSIEQSSYHHLSINRMKDLSNYNEAITTLNTLQSNRVEILARVLNADILRAKLNRIRTLLYQLDVSQDDLCSMNIIHISGTKGKGSTCAFIESILRKKGFKTGLFTSPHLISVRERIQLDGKPIDKDLFAGNFFHVYNKLRSLESNTTETNDPSSDKTSLPFYFNFLTLMALYTFKQQGCNATIIEVGIGGEFDCTNIVDRPIVVGVSSLGIDHVKLLGRTLSEIAWHKSGIFKSNVPAFTSNNQQIEALTVLQQRAEERNCPLRICPDLNEYQIEEGRKIKLGINGQVQKLNASLAFQICNCFLNRTTYDTSIRNRYVLDFANTFKLDSDYLDAIEECKWRGRFETLQLKNKSTFHLDGAHTVESLQYCIDWFKNECATINDNRKLFKILIFNCTGHRDYAQLLSPLLKVEKFDMICFTSNLKKVQDLNNTNSDLFNAAQDQSNRDELKECVLKSLHFIGSVKHFDCLENCLKSINVKNEENLLNNLHTKVLVTGSLHLVGGVISLLNEFYF